MPGSWVDDARKTLIELRGSAAGWSYFDRGEPAVEPTVFACLALLSGENARDHLPLVEQSARWLAAMQQPDGSVGLSEKIRQPAWPTAPAILLWSAVRSRVTGDAQSLFDSARTRAATWLLARRGVTFANMPNGPIGHDTTIAGWPWVSSTHSWIEPTALAILALATMSGEQSNRAEEGFRLLVDREIPSGGWNYGNRIVFGAPLRPMPGPTGLVLLALTRRKEAADAVNRGATYLKKELSTVRSPESLAWGMLALDAWNSRPAESDAWLSESFDSLRGRRPAVLAYAGLILTAGKLSVELLGAVRREAPHG